jgi:hypothetical protein
MERDMNAINPNAVQLAPLLQEKLTTVKKAADTLGLPPWKLRRAAKAGAFPTYTVLNSRRLVRLSEVIAAIEASKKGGSDV